MKKMIKNIASKLGVEIRRYSQEKCISLRPENEYNGSVLLSYTINPFLLKEGETFVASHVTDWECFQITKTFLDMGYCVDVIKYTDEEFIPKKDYTIFIDVLSNLERIAPRLNKDCIKILHPAWAHWLFHNNAAYKRYLAFQQRKGVTLKLRKILKPNLGIEYADCVTLRGGKFSADTYSYAQKPIYYLPHSTNALYSWPKDKNYETCRNRFLWFGSGGLVHKGLDLVLDAFAEMPDYHLYICGPIQQEKDFEKAYYKELYQTHNIHTIGWVDVTGYRFIEITNKCIGIIFPSCSEGRSGGVLTCMHAGVIPIVSYESSVDVGDFGVILKDCSIDEIKISMRTVSSLPTEELKRMSRRAWEYARANHTRERFAEEYQKVIKRIIANHHR